MFFKNLTIAGKLQLGLGLLIAILAGLGVYLLVSIGNYEEFVKDIQNSTEYNIMVEEIQIENLRKVDLLKRYVFDRNPVYLKEIQASTDLISINLERLQVLGSNPIILNSLSDIKDTFGEREELINSLQLLISLNEVGSDQFVEQTISMDKLSAELIYDLDRINEVATVEKLKQTELLENNFYFNRLTSLVLILIVSLFLIVVSYLLTNSISNPLKMMNVAAGRIAEGDFDFEIEVNSNDEIGTLMKTFNNMRGKINDSYRVMEDKVNARTRKLNEAVDELNGTKESLIGTLQVLEQKQKNIEEQKIRFEAILFNLGEGLVFLNLDQEVIFGNKAVTDLLGYSSSDYVGKKWYEVVKPSYEDGTLIPEDKLTINSLLSDPNLGKMTVRLSDGQFYQSKNNTKVPVSLVTSKVVNDGETIGLILVFKDVTKEKEVDKAKTEFVSLASHQLRTPLTSISWNTEMLINEEVGKIDEEQKIYLEEIYYGSKRMIDLVNSLLNTSRIDLGNFLVEPEDVNLEEFTQEIAEELNSNFEERKISFNASYEEIGVRKIDKKLYHILVENLLTNAIKYTPMEGSVSLDLSRNEDGILVKVADTGYGIPKDQIHKIFSKLFRADNVKSKDTDGTGLGLYLVKSIVDYIDGKIWFESEENKGTTFYILLPDEGMKAKHGDKTLNTK